MGYLDPETFNNHHSGGEDSYDTTQKFTPATDLLKNGKSPEKPKLEDSYPHYFKDVKNLDTIDVYRVLTLFGVIDPCIQHAVKKLLCAGDRGAKDYTKDVKEAIVSLTRCLEMK